MKILVALIAIMAVIFIYNEVFADSITLTEKMMDDISRSHPAFLGIHAYQCENMSYLPDRIDVPELNMKVLGMIEKERTQRYKMTLI